MFVFSALPFLYAKLLNGAVVLLSTFAPAGLGSAGLGLGSLAGLGLGSLAGLGLGSLAGLSLGSLAGLSLGSLAGLSLDSR